MNKHQDEFLDHFARLGVFSKVQSLMETGGETEGDVIKSQEEGAFSKVKETSSLPTPPETQEDAKEILPGKAYLWREWNICRGRDCLYIWSDSAALELSNGSNGWFRFILDGKLATMYSR